MFVHYGVPLRVPEAGAVSDPDDESHVQDRVTFGGTSESERDRIKGGPGVILIEFAPLVCCLVQADPGWKAQRKA
ncbi:hypothetical protein ACFWBR_19280 [Streptomyces sp. NPDC060006]|uniref:hypothetical protein n=1 Tax=unclassified Streptomyces TaxID=2593676 RepID=UPI0036AFCE18